MDDLDAAVAFLEAGNPPAPESGFLGADVPAEMAAVVLVPVPWEATVSGGSGTADGPQAIIRASHELDLEDRFFGRPYRHGIAVLSENPQIRAFDREARPAALQAIAALERGDRDAAATERVNAAGRKRDALLLDCCRRWLAKDRIIGVIGGDHGCPAALATALSERYDAFAVLHLDAHFDLRVDYEGFHASHASIMHRLLHDHDGITRLVAVGIRDYCRAEAEAVTALGPRGSCFYATDIHRRLAQGACWHDLVREILDALPGRVYISCDVDVLEPALCPHTGTPVPGGLTYDQVMYLLEELAASGRSIIGFDCCECAADPWDAQVAARLIYKLCGAALAPIARLPSADG